MRLPPAHSYHILQNLAKLFPAARINPSGDTMAEIAKIDEAGHNLPCQLDGCLVWFEKFPVVTAVHFPKYGNEFIKQMEQGGGGLVSIISDVNLSGTDGLYLATLLSGYDEETQWFSRMTKPQLIMGTVKDVTVMAAPIKAFL